MHISEFVEPFLRCEIAERGLGQEYSPQLISDALLYGQNLPELTPTEDTFMRYLIGKPNINVHTDELRRNVWAGRISHNTISGHATNIAEKGWPILGFTSNGYMFELLLRDPFQFGRVEYYPESGRINKVFTSEFVFDNYKKMLDYFIFNANQLVLFRDILRIAEIHEGTFSNFMTVLKDKIEMVSGPQPFLYYPRGAYIFRRPELDHNYPIVDARDFKGNIFRGQDCSEVRIETSTFTFFPHMSLVSFHELRRGEVVLPHTEHTLLAFLLKNSGIRLTPRDIELGLNLLGVEANIETIITKAVPRLRNFIESDPLNPRHLTKHYNFKL
jgi:DNA-binding response OmpR family regulator